MSMATLKKGKQGGSMQGLEVSPEHRKRTAKRRKRQEIRWANKSGPVRSRPLTDDEPDLGL